MKLDSMIRLSNQLQELFRSYGFTGERGEWRHVGDPEICCIGIQERSDNAAFCVNLGVHLAFLPVAGQSGAPDVNSITTVDCEIMSRLGWRDESEHWWEFKSLESSVADVIACYEEHGRSYFDRFSNFPHPFVDIGVDDLDNDDVSTLFPIMTRVRKLLLIARVYDYLDDSKSAVYFSRIGLDAAGRAVAPKVAFRAILKKHEAGKRDSPIVES